MHGVKREKYTEAVAKARKQAEQQKIAEYQALDAKVKALRADACKTDEALEATEQLLSMNPEYYSLWNYRREIILDRLATRPEDEVQSLCEEELKFIVGAIQAHPKSYWVWHHRVWVLEHMPRPNWEYEVHLCAKMLDLDIRNFHCWDFRRKMVARVEKMRPADELEYTYKKICQNFSNYSAFHLRSKLLPLVYPDTDEKLQFESLKRDFELVKNAVFTEPADQSPWMYHRWLLGRSQNRLGVMGAFRHKANLLVVFSEPVKLRDNALVVTTQEGQVVAGNWTPAHWIPNHYCHIWSFTPAEPFSSSPSPSLLLEVDASGVLAAAAGSYMKKNVKVEVLATTNNPANMGAGPPSNSHKKIFNADILQAELQSIMELVELEPDSKWPLLSSALIQHVLGHFDEAIATLQRLIDLDPYRKNYYRDLKSNLILEKLTNSLLSMTADEDSATLSPLSGHHDFSNKGLTTLAHTERLCVAHTVNLSTNELVKMNGIYALLSVEELSLDNNLIESLQGLAHLTSLRSLSLANNRLATLDSISDLLKTTIPLESLDLRGNPVTQIPGYKEAVTRQFPTLKTLDGASL